MPDKLTGKQSKLIKLISENIGLDDPKTMEEMMLEAGYAPSVAKQQSLILAGIKDDMDDIVKAMEEERTEILKALKVKRPDAQYRDLIAGLDKTTKNIQLLGGKATSRVDVLDTKTQEEIDGLIDEN